MQRLSCVGLSSNPRDPHVWVLAHHASLDFAVRRWASSSNHKTKTSETKRETTVTINRKRTMPQEGRTLRTVALYSEEGHSLLKNSLEKSKELGEGEQSPTDTSSSAIHHGYSSSDDEAEDHKYPSSSESEESDEDENITDDVKVEEDAKEGVNPGSDCHKAQSSDGKSKPRKEPKRNKQSKQHMWHIKSLRDNLICTSLPLDDESYLAMPTSLLGKEMQWSGPTSAAKCESYLSLTSELAGIETDKKTVVVLLLRSGRFAGGIFEGDRCLVHRAFQRYTVRKGQGKAQSAQDTKRKAKSMGAQLRRAGEQSLREDIQSTILEWKDHIKRSCLILLSCPKAMKATIFSELVVQEVVARDDKRIRKIPFDIGRPTFESVCDSHEVLLNATVRSTDKKEATGDLPTPASQQVQDEDETQSDLQKADKRPEEEVTIPLTPLHEAARDANLPAALELLSKDGDSAVTIIDQLAGPDFMTPLHYAAAASSKADPSAAAACVLALLIQGRADPCAFDARSRPPYFLATHDTVREAFRKARATLGESYCDWEQGKVGPPLTDEDIQARKAKEADKKRRKKARQKEKKAKEKAQAEDLARQRKEEEDRQKQAEDAKRIRDGLQPRTSNATNVCDFCQKVCKGKRRNQMFQRLDYVYCSSDCVQKHKRELMASAALARFG